MYYRVFYQLGLWLWGTADVLNDKWVGAEIGLLLRTLRKQPFEFQWLPLTLWIWISTKVFVEALQYDCTENAYGEQEPAAVFPEYLSTSLWLIVQLFRCETRGSPRLLLEGILNLVGNVPLQELVLNLHLLKRFAGTAKVKTLYVCAWFGTKVIK